MTLIIAAQGNDFVILGADSRGTIIDIAKNRLQVNLMTKLHKINEQTGILISGAGDQAMHIIEKFEKLKDRSRQGVSEITHELVTYCQNEFKMLKEIPVPDLPSFVLVVAGVDMISNIRIPYCYYMHSHSGFLPSHVKHGYVIKGKPLIAEYLFTKHYDPNKSVNELCELVTSSINDTINVDGDVGGQIHIAIVGEDGFREYSEDDVEGFIKENLYIESD